MKNSKVVFVWVPIGMLLLFTIHSVAGNRQEATADELFTTSGQCAACHNQLTAADGGDISIGVHFRSAMMSLSAVDPYWQASVRREVMDHPAAAAQIEDTCSSCHMPMARIKARHTGGHGAVFSHLANGMNRFDSPDAALAADGVSCSVCHQIGAGNLGKKESFSANFEIDPRTKLPGRSIFGPFQVSDGSAHIMKSATGFVPVKASHLRASAHCGSCHTLYTHALDKNGKAVAELAEQMPYIEWLYSHYKDTQSCQDCHMEKIDGEAAISSVLGKARSGLKKHSFVGGNYFMLKMLSRNRTELGLQAQVSELNRSAEASEALLTDSSAEIAIDQTALVWKNGTLSFPVVVTNLAGHKLPTAYPSRRVWVRVRITDSNDQVLFESGALNDDGSIVGNDNDRDGFRYEPHHGIISSAEQVQIYESIMATPQGQVTTGLLSAASYLKDNRIPPFGFDKTAVSRDVAVWGHAFEDDDFGDGRDRTLYRIRLAEEGGDVRIVVELWYQSIGFRWAENLADVAADEPRRFTSMLRRMNRRDTAIRMVSHQVELRRPEIAADAIEEEAQQIPF